MRPFIDWWLELGTWWKVSVSLILILISTVLWFGFERWWPYGWAVGVILLLFSFPNEAQRKGYHDF